MGIQCILNHFAMKTLILFCLFSISLSATDIELFSPAEDRTVCCLTATNNCASYCAEDHVLQPVLLDVEFLCLVVELSPAHQLLLPPVLLHQPRSQLQSLLLYLLLYQLLPLFLP